MRGLRSGHHRHRLYRLSGASRQPENWRAEGFEVKVINARFIKPLDAELILSTATSVNKIMTVEENVLDGGFGSAVLELLAQNGITGVTVRRLGIRDEFVEHATQAELRSSVWP